MITRGMTPTSERHVRSCEAGMRINQTRTQRNSAANTNVIRPLLTQFVGAVEGDSLALLSALIRSGKREVHVSHKAHMLNAAKATASTSRSQAHGRLEK